MLRSNLLLLLPDARDHTLRSSIRKHAVDDGSRMAMLEDAHLLEAALRTDETVASMDNRARRHFATVSEQIDSIRDIMWVNPDTESAFCLNWLTRGAPMEPERQLGYQHRPR